MEVVENSAVIPPYLKGLLTRGRSRNSAVWMATQRPVNVHPLCISQCKHLFIFDMNLDQDRKKVADVTGVADFLNRPGWHNFWYWFQGMQSAIKGRLEG